MVSRSIAIGRLSLGTEKERQRRTGQAQQKQVTQQEIR
jgi:hypothetical protein